VISGGQSKISELAGQALVGDQDVLRLQIPVVDSNRVAVFNSIQNLEESTLSPVIVTNELALLSDVGEQVTFRAVLHDNVCAIRGIHDLDQRNNVGVRASLVVELDLALLELALARLKTDLVKRLYSIGNVGLDVHGGVDNSISSNPEDAGELKPTSENLT
jgi:CO dehydrogenase/acetyl-CoA synthase beta subunit